MSRATATVTPADMESLDLNDHRHGRMENANGNYGESVNESVNAGEGLRNGSEGGSEYIDWDAIDGNDFWVPDAVAAPAEVPDVLAGLVELEDVVAGVSVRQEDVSWHELL